MTRYIESTSEAKMIELENIINHHLIIIEGNKTRKVVDVHKHLTEDRWFLDYDLLMTELSKMPTNDLKIEREQQIGEFVGDNSELTFETYDNGVEAGFELPVE